MPHSLFHLILCVSSVCITVGCAVFLPFLIGDWLLGRRRNRVESRDHEKMLMLRALDQKGLGLVLMVSATGAGKTNTFWAGMEAMRPRGRVSRRRWFWRFQAVLFGCHSALMLAWFVYERERSGSILASCDLITAALSALYFGLLCRFVSTQPQ